MPDLFTHFTSLDAGFQAVFLFRKPTRLEKGQPSNTDVEEFIFSSERPKINSSWHEQKCCGCGRVEELSELFTVLLHL